MFALTSALGPHAASPNTVTVEKSTARNILGRKEKRERKLLFCHRWHDCLHTKP